MALVLMYIAFPSGEAKGEAGAAPSQHLRASRLTSVPARMEFLIVTDLDKKSLVDPTSKKPRWKAFLKKAGVPSGSNWRVPVCPSSRPATT